MRPRAAVQPSRGPIAPGKAPIKVAKGGEAFKRGVNGDVGEGGEQGQGHGEQVGVEQPESAECQGSDAGCYAGGQRDASGGQWALCGADHAGIAFALDCLVQCAGAGRDQPNADQGIQQPALHARYARLHRSQIEASPAGDQHHGRNPDLKQFLAIVNQRRRGPGPWRMNRGRAVNAGFGYRCGKIR